MINAPGNYNLYTVQGNTLDVSFRFKVRSESGEIGPANLDGSEIIFTSVMPGLVIVKSLLFEASDGSARLVLTPAETRQFAVGRMPFELEQRTGEVETTLAKGFVYVTRGENVDG